MMSYEWLVRKLKATSIVGVNNLYKGKKSFDVNLRNLLPGGSVEPEVQAASRRYNALEEKTKLYAHNIIFPDTVYFEKGKPLRYYYTKNIDDDVLARPGTDTRKRRERRGFRKTQEQLDEEEEWGNALSQRVVTAMVRLRSSAEMITIAKDFYARILGTRKRKIYFEKKLLELQILSSQLFFAATVQSRAAKPQLGLVPVGSVEKVNLLGGAQKALMRDPYIVHPGFYTNKMAITSFPTNLVPPRPNALAYPNGEMPKEIEAKYQEMMFRNEAAKKGLNSPTGGKAGGTSWSDQHAVTGWSDAEKQWGKRFEKDHSKLSERLEVLRVNYADGAVRLWSEKDMEDFCALRKPKRQDFMDVVSVQSIPYAGLGGYTNLQFITYNYSEELLNLKRRMRKISPTRARETAAYDPSPKHRDDHVVPNPFKRKGGEADEDEVSPAKKAAPRSASEAPSGARKKKKDGAKGGASSDAEKRGGGSKEKASKEAPDHKEKGEEGEEAAAEKDDKPLYMSPDLERMKGYFPGANVVCARVVNGKIEMPELPQRPVSVPARKKKGAKAAARSSMDNATRASVTGSKGPSGADADKSAKPEAAQAASKESTVQIEEPEEPPMTPKPKEPEQKLLPRLPLPTLASPIKAASMPNELDALTAKDPSGILNLEKEAMMEEAVHKINKWLDEKFHLRIVGGAFEFGFALTPKFTEVEEKIKQQTDLVASQKDKTPAELAASAGHVASVFAPPRPTLRCFLADAAGLVVKRTLNPAKFREQQKAAQEDGPAILGELTGASENESGGIVVSSDPDSSPHGGMNEPESPYWKRRKKSELKTDAGRNMLAAMNGLWSPLQGSSPSPKDAPTRTNTGNLKGDKSPKAEPRKDETQLLIEETVLAAGNCIAVDHTNNFKFIRDKPNKCGAKAEDQKKGLPSSSSLRQLEAESVRKQRAAPIGALLLARCDTAPGGVGEIPSVQATPSRRGREKDSTASRTLPGSAGPRAGGIARVSSSAGKIATPVCLTNPMSFAKPVESQPMDVLTSTSGHLGHLLGTKRHT